jgi:DNA-binding NtrC family response regulator
MPCHPDHRYGTVNTAVDAMKMGAFVYIHQAHRRPLKIAVNRRCLSQMKEVNVVLRDHL